MLKEPFFQRAQTLRFRRFLLQQKCTTKKKKIHIDTKIFIYFVSDEQPAFQPLVHLRRACVLLELLFVIPFSIHPSLFS